MKFKYILLVILCVSCVSTTSKNLCQHKFKYDKKYKQITCINGGNTKIKINNQRKVITPIE